MYTFLPFPFRQFFFCCCRCLNGFFISTPAISYCRANIAWIICHGKSLSFFFAAVVVVRKFNNRQQFRQWLFLLICFPFLCSYMFRVFPLEKINKLRIRWNGWKVGVVCTGFYLDLIYYYAFWYNLPSIRHPLSVVYYIYAHIQFLFLFLRYCLNT